jgi:head-tail adaptor
VASLGTIGTVGAMRERVTIQSKSNPGPGDPGWTNTTTTWASVTSVPFARNTEEATASGLRAKVQYHVQLRNRTVTPEQRLIWRDTTLQINAVHRLNLEFIGVLATEIQ